MSIRNHLKIAKNSVVRVGDGGRGFVVSASEGRRLVITAAHCLPRRILRPGLLRTATEETYKKLIGPLDLGARGRGPKPNIWAELYFIDPMSDIAVLGEPDSDELSDEHDRYQEFTGAIDPVPIGAPPPTMQPHRRTTANENSAFVLSLKGVFEPVTAQYGGRFVEVRKGSDKIKNGMSGSPIIDGAGNAIAIISTGGVGGGPNWNPSVMDCLPRWLLAGMI